MNTRLQSSICVYTRIYFQFVYTRRLTCAYTLHITEYTPTIIHFSVYKHSIQFVYTCRLTCIYKQHTSNEYTPTIMMSVHTRFLSVYTHVVDTCMYTHPPSPSKFTPFCFGGFSSYEDILYCTTRCGLFREQI